MNTFAEDLQSLESALQRVLQSPDYADIVKSGHYNPEMSLLDALHAVQQLTKSTKKQRLYAVSKANE